MLYSKLFGKTVKSVPSNLKEESHKLLYKAGYIRQVSAGRYAYLPLGYRVWDKIQDIIDDEMEAIGSQRINTPIFHPIEIWKSTNRDAAFGGEMHIIEDHHGATFAIGATAEGLMVELAKEFNLSYRDMPFYIHQFIGKFRDEKRPRGGLLRVREFTMKDAYSFDETEEALNETYQKFFDAYLKIAERLDLKVHPVLADSGAIGGDYNHEFIVESSAGEGGAFLCDSCDYAAGDERAAGTFEDYEQDKEVKDIEEYWDDTVVNCEILAEKMGVPLQATTKTILFKADDTFVAAMVRGDYDINEAKLARYLKADSLELASEEDIKKLTGAEVGFMGPVNLPEEIKVVADLSCENRTNFEAGGNKTGLHLYNLNYEKDFPTPDFADIRSVHDGDGCTECKKGKLREIRGIEWGHCFKLDQFYSKPHNATFTNKEGENKIFWMGSYGIGLGRSVATIVETHHDENGIVWPEHLAPFKIHLVGLNLDDEKVAKKATELYEKLKEENIDVLFDDRVSTRPGEKFADADLIGCPYRVVVSAKTDKKYETKKRTEDKASEYSLEDLIKTLS